MIREKSTILVFFQENMEHCGPGWENDEKKVKNVEKGQN
jgi:hypothetical protein